MEIDIKPGRYVVAVSGGVDSMVLLHLLTRLERAATSEIRNSKFDLVVAHFDHGIRPDSSEDRRLVQAAVERYGLPFEYEEGKLGASASEAEARKARYDFLERVRQKSKAGAIITAHHQDDLIETAILNLLRGTGRRGLSSLASRPGVVRPLLGYSKAAILAYAQAHGLSWREDSTNSDDRHLRNYIRHHIVPDLTYGARRRLISELEQIQATNQALDAELTALLGLIARGSALERQLFTELPHDVAKELLAAWLRRQGMADFDHKTLERVVVAAKTKPLGTQIDLLHGNSLLVTKSQLALRARER